MWAFHNKNFYNLNFEQQQESIFKTRGECILFLLYRGLVSGLRHDCDVKVTFFGKNPPCFCGHFVDWLCIRARSPDI